MNKYVLKQLNVVPEGKEPWLSYNERSRLQHLFDAVPLSDEKKNVDNFAYLELYWFLTDIAGLNLPFDEATIHYNAFVLLRRGYKVESITDAEYAQLHRLMDGLETPDIDDAALYDTGGHRALYDYLSKGLGLSVREGRGPAWHRANDLVKHYESERMSKLKMRDKLSVCPETRP
ncbi:MAG TPA: hypothetical protein G4N96_04290 [Chloroflexi bacterium]|nr:hypothetical protein [Chloroflexota bacterium]